MTLAVHKPKKKQKRKITKEDEFQRLWRKVVKQKKLNSQRQDELKAFVLRVEAEISNQETILVATELARIKKLIEFFSRKSLSNWQRDELCELININFSLIDSNPFSDFVTTHILKDQFTEQLDIWYPEEEFDDESFLFAQQKEEAGTHNDKEKSSKQGDQYGGEDLFGDVDEQCSEFEEEADFFERLCDEFSGQSQFDHEAKAKEDKLKKINSLLKRSSIKHMFRRIAKVLHPDKEQDEALKEEKHHLMAQLIEARNKKDVLAIFALYAEHVGEMPDDMAKEDLENISLLLKYQLEKLKEEYDAEPYKDQKTAMFYDIFYAKTEKGLQRNIRERKKEIEKSIIEANTFLARITSVTKLKLLLKEHYYRHHEVHF